MFIKYLSGTQVDLYKEAETIYAYIIRQLTQSCTFSSNEKALENLNVCLIIELFVFSTLP